MRMLGTLCFSFEFCLLGSRNDHEHEQRESFLFYCCTAEKMRIDCCQKMRIHDHWMHGTITIRFFSSEVEIWTKINVWMHNKHKTQTQTDHLKIHLIGHRRKLTNILNHTLETILLRQTSNILQETSTKLMRSDPWQRGLRKYWKINIVGNTATLQILRKRPTNHMQKFCQSNQNNAINHVCTIPRCFRLQ